MLRCAILACALAAPALSKAERGRIVLNGVWRFQPVAAEAAPAPESWGLIRVPGSWKDAGRTAGIVSRGAGRSWEGFGDGTAAVWYERTVRVPAAWAGQRVILTVRRLATDADVFANGRACGRISWPQGEADLTDAVRPGATAEIRLKVVAVADAAQVLRLMGPGAGQQETGTAALEGKGLIGDVFLESRPSGGWIADVFIRTSVARRELALDVETAGLARPGSIRFTARLLHPSGRTERVFRASAEAPAGSGTVTVAWPWPDPRLWDAGAPELYELVLEARGPGMNDAIRRTFGFREFGVAGRHFILNGTQIRLRPAHPDREQWGGAAGTVEHVRGVLSGLRNAGFNLVELWPVDHDERGVIHYRDVWMDEADRMGMLLIGPALAPNAVVGWDGQLWDDASRRADWVARMQREMRAFRNHPSVVIWAAGGNLFGHVHDQDPRRLGRSGWVPVLRRDSGPAPSAVEGPAADAAWNKRARAGFAALDLIRRADPTRPVFTHQGAYVGDVYGINNYLCLLPLQEREEWLSAWTRDGDLPYMAVEFGTPLHCTFMRGRRDGGWGGGGATHSEPWFTEFCAVYLGPEAYALESPGYRAAIGERFTGGQLYTSWQSEGRANFMPSTQSVLSLFIRNTWRSWRTMGITGGMVPWNMAHGWEEIPGVPVVPAVDRPDRRGPFRKDLDAHDLAYLDPSAYRVYPAARELVGVNGPTLAWIAGPAPTDADRAAFTAKDHLFAPGARVEKSVVVINDRRAAVAYEASWRVTLGGRELAADTVRGTLSPAETRFLPVRFAVPGDLAVKTDGLIETNVRLGGTEHRDAFGFRVVPTPAAAGGTVAVFDPAGDTAAWLRALGAVPRPWAAGDPVPAVLVVGRDALAGGALDPAVLEPLVRGGTAVLVMAQDADWMRARLGLRVSRHASRRVFPVIADHPALAGLDAEDLRDWAGASRAGPPYPAQDDPATEPPYGWRWGGRGAVATAALEIPHFGNWTPVAACEFDMAFSPLLELAYGRGHLMLCAFDLEEHVAGDPAARRLAGNLLGYLRACAAAPPAPAPGRAAFLGNAGDGAFLDSLGLVYDRVRTVPGEDRLLVVSADARVPAHLMMKFARRGRLAVLAARDGRHVLGAALGGATEFSGTPDVPQHPLARGLSPSDLHVRAAAGVRLLDAVQPALPGMTVAAGGFLGFSVSGKGAIVLCQLDPGSLSADERTYLRFTRWRWTRAVRQVLGNLGASFLADRRIFTARPPAGIPLAGAWQARITTRMASAPGMDRPHPDPGLSAAARALLSPEAREEELETVELPGFWEARGGAWEGLDGEVVFRRWVEVPAARAAEPLVLSLGAVDDFDETYVNGVKVGATGPKVQDFWSVPRVYRLPAGLVKPGRNLIAVRVFDHFGGGGFGGPAAAMALANVPAADPERLYHPDYRDDFDLGDDPFRYKRW